ncbi:MAG: hypothetical protein SFV23_04385 [Planctomycetaceae bacterium]|nr:hypothetical protein [Planctomycetaceae bacterium]
MEVGVPVELADQCQARLAGSKSRERGRAITAVAGKKEFPPGKPPQQDGRKLRRYRHRWKVEWTIAWLGTCRRLLVRHEHYDHLYDGFVQLA